MDRIKSGDRNALGAIYDRHSRRVFSMAMSSLGDYQESEEITQDIFLKLWNRGGSYNAEKSKLTTWLTAITRNRIIDQIRKKRRQRTEQENTLDIASIPSNEISPEDETVSKIEGESIRSILNVLPEEQRAVVEFSYFKGLTHREIAEQMNIPAGTVKTRIRLALQKMRNHTKTSAPQASL